MPGSERAVRQVIESGRAGDPNYDQMSPEFAQIVRAQVESDGLYAPAKPVIEPLTVFLLCHGLAHE